MGQSPIGLFFVLEVIFVFDMFSKLTYLDILYAALTSFVITHLIINLNKLRRNIYETG